MDSGHSEQTLVCSCSALGLHVLTHSIRKMDQTDQTKYNAVLTTFKEIRQQKLQLKRKYADADVNSHEDDGTPVLFNACNNLKNLEKFLAHPNIDVNIKDKDGWTALMNACAKGMTDAVKRLCQVPGIDLNIQNRAGHTAAIIAIMNDNTECIKILSNVPGIKWNIRVVADYTAVKYAAHHRKTEIIKILSTVPGVDWNLNVQSINGLNPLKFALDECPVDNLKILLKNPTVENASVFSCDTPMEYLKKYRQEVFNKLINNIPEEPTPDYNEHEIAAKRQKTDDIEAPDCSVCCEKFSGNSEIYHCNKGHWVCGRCYEQIDVCQVCGLKIIGRSHDIETFIQKYNL